MITGELISQIDRIWDTCWSGGIANPLEVMEQLTYLLFIKRLNDIVRAPACGTGGFLVVTGECLRETYPDIFLDDKLEALKAEIRQGLTRLRATLAGQEIGT